MIREERLQKITELATNDADGILNTRGTCRAPGRIFGYRSPRCQRDVQRGILEKTRGGIVLKPRESSPLDPIYEMRLSKNVDEKNRMQGRHVLYKRR
jgi:hypothetical protein